MARALFEFPDIAHGSNLGLGADIVSRHASFDPVVEGFLNVGDAHSDAFGR